MHRTARVSALTRMSRYASLTLFSTAVSVGMAPAGSKISLDPAMFMLGAKRFIGCTEGGSNPPVVRIRCHTY